MWDNIKIYSIEKYLELKEVFDKLNNSSDITILVKDFEEYNYKKTYQIKDMSFKFIAKLILYCYNDKK